jgi:hypothetical protein
LLVQHVPQEEPLATSHSSLHTGQGEAEAGVSALRRRPAESADLAGLQRCRGAEAMDHHDAKSASGRD